MPDIAVPGSVAVPPTVVAESAELAVSPEVVAPPIESPESVIQMLETRNN